VAQGTSCGFLIRNRVHYFLDFSPPRTHARWHEEIPKQDPFHSPRVGYAGGRLYGKPHEARGTHQIQQEIRGSAVEGSAVQPTFTGNVFRQSLAQLRDLRFLSYRYKEIPSVPEKGRSVLLEQGHGASCCSAALIAKPKLNTSQVAHGGSVRRHWSELPTLQCLLNP
jgi:hypothetical protein